MLKTVPSIDSAAIPADLRAVLDALARVARELSFIIRRGTLGQSLGAEVGENSDGDRQKALDVLADDAFVRELSGTGVRWYASEERDRIGEIDADGIWALAVDPLDGSSNIDANVSIGTIFSIYPAKDNAGASILRPVAEQVAAGYVIYGPQTQMMLTFGDGVQQYILDPASDRFCLAVAKAAIPHSASEFAINASNYRHWSKPIRAYIDDCLAGIDGPRGKKFNMRWIASLVAETHRILSRGGIFLYPADDRPGYENGRLRLVYECAPIAFLMEQAGGGATDGFEPIMSKRSEELHQRTPFVFGSQIKVDRVTAYQDLSDHEVAALFTERGLFRV